MIIALNKIIKGDAVPTFRYLKENSASLPTATTTRATLQKLECELNFLAKFVTVSHIIGIAS